jgi:hypothetical protein
MKSSAILPMARLHLIIATNARRFRVSKFK